MAPSFASPEDVRRHPSEPLRRPTIGRFRPFTREESVVRRAPPVLGTGATGDPTVERPVGPSDGGTDGRRTDLLNDGGGGGGGRHPISTRS